MHSTCIRVDSLLSAREYTAPIHSTGSHPNTSLLRACWTPARTLRRSHTGRHIPGGAASTRSACTLRVERPRRTAVHFFPHTRPPDTHSHLSQPPTTPPLDCGAALEYPGSLANIYFLLVLSSMPKKRSGYRRPHGAATMARSRDDAASEIETASVDGARDMSTSFAREGSGDLDCREVSGGPDSRRPDRDPSPFLPTRGAERGGFTFGSSRRYGTSSPSPAAAGGGARGGDHEERGRIWKKAASPLTTLSASAACTGTRTFLATSTSFSTFSVSNSDGC